MRELLSTDEIAERLRVHVSTVRAWIRDGRIPAVRLGPRLLRVRWTSLLEAASIHRPASTRPIDPKIDGSTGPVDDCRRPEDEEPTRVA